MPVRLEPNIKTLRMLKALDNPVRINILSLVVNSSPVSFSEIHGHLEETGGHDVSKGTLAYHLDILVQSDVLTRELGRGPDRTYSRYDMTAEAEAVLRGLGLLVEVS